MERICIDADALFRAVTATGYKLLAYNLDLRTGEIVARTLTPDEVKAGPEGPSVKPLPKLGGELAPRTNASPFGPPPVSSKPKLFGDDGGPKKPAFGGDFWKRDDKSKPDLFGEGFKRESGSKKLAELFSGPPKAARTDPFAKNETPHSAKKEAGTPKARPPLGDDPYYPRIPAATEETHLDWMRTFAREAGDPLLREELSAALKTAKPAAAFERALRNHLRLGQQWERYVRKQALACAEAWLGTLGVEWTLEEKEH